MVEGSGRVVRWKHTLYDWLKVSKVELAVMAELLLRGPQTEGDLRARASRMEPLADLPALQTCSKPWRRAGWSSTSRPPGQKRGVVVTHGLYPPEEAEKVRQAFARQATLDDDERAARAARRARRARRRAAAPGWAAEVAALRAEVEALRGTVEALAAELRELKSALGV